MNFWQFVSELAWPTVVLIIFLYCRKPILKLIKGFTKVGIKSGDMEIYAQAEAVFRQLQNQRVAGDYLSVTEETCNYGTYLRLLSAMVFFLGCTLRYTIMEGIKVENIEEWNSYIKATVAKVGKEQPESEWLPMLHKLDAYFSFVKKGG